MLHGVDVAGCWGQTLRLPGGVASGATIKSHEKGVQPLRRRIAIESSRGSLPRVERPSAAGIRNGLGLGRLHATPSSFG